MIFSDPNDPSNAYLEINGMKNEEGLFILGFLISAILSPVFYFVNNRKK